MRKFVTIFAALIAFAWFGWLHAAEILPSNASPDVESISLTGEIQLGDLEKLRTLVDQLSFTKPVELHLNSPGGAFLEGLDIAEFLSGRNIETVLDKNAICLSACAMIFIAGSEFEEIYMAKRRMHVTAKLGFHAPYLLAAGRSYSPTHVQESYADGLRAVGRMMEIGRLPGRDGFLSISIILRILKRGPTELYVIDDVIKANELEIELDGVPKAKWTASNICNACIVRNDGRARTDACDQPVSEKKISSKIYQYVFDGFAGEGSWSCVIRLDIKKNNASIIPTTSADQISDGGFIPLSDEDALPVSLRREF